MKPGRNKLSAYDAGEGALYVLYCAARALHPRAPRFLAVDNVDQALNPLLARKLTERLCGWTGQLDGDRQWFLTLHNPAVLDGLPLGDDQVRLFAVERNSQGHTALRRIDLAAASRASVNPSRLDFFAHVDGRAPGDGTECLTRCASPGWPRDRPTESS